jgi:glycine/D-amino acid oxidase-like deaminating enzyme
MGRFCQWMGGDEACCVQVRGVGRRLGGWHGAGMSVLPPSLYAATARPAPDTPPLAQDASVTVAIVGAGFAGLSTALHLAERGVRALVIDAEEPGWGASGRNGGHVNPGLKEDPETVLARFGAEPGGRLLDFSYGAPDMTFDLIRRHQIQCDARQGGTLRAARTEAHAAGVRQAAAECLARGMPVQLLDAAGAAAATGGEGYVCAMLDPRGGDVQPLDFARGLARAAIAAGAAVHGGTPALSLERQGAGWRLRTPGAEILAERVVLATNGYTGGLWPGLAQTIVPVFSSLMASAPLPDAVRAAILPGRSVLYENGRITVYCRVDAAGRMLLGGRGPQSDLSGPGGLQYLMRLGEERWPGLRGVEWTHGWNGQLAVTLDHYPHLHELAPGLLAYLGCNGRGVALATAMGRELARHVMGEPSVLPVSAPRPMRLHRFWKAGVAAAVIKGRVLDRLGL